MWQVSKWALHKSLKWKKQMLTTRTQSPMWYQQSDRYKPMQRHTNQPASHAQGDTENF